MNFMSLRVPLFNRPFFLTDFALQFLFHRMGFAHYENRVKIN